MKNRPPRIVVVEDNPADIALLRHALAERGEDFEITVLTDGEQALRFIASQRDDTEPRPCVIVLDLHLPRYDGTDVLRAIMREPVLDHVQVAVWTTLGSPEERMEAERLGVSLYELKPCSLEGFTRFAEKLLNLCHGRTLNAAI